MFQHHQIPQMFVVCRFIQPRFYAGWPKYAATHSILHEPVLNLKRTEKPYSSLTLFTCDIFVKKRETSFQPFDVVSLSGIFTNPSEWHHCAPWRSSQTDTGKQHQPWHLDPSPQQSLSWASRPGHQQRKICQISPPTPPISPPHPPLLFLPLSLFLKAWLHHPQCPHFNNASEISHWLQEAGGGGGRREGWGRVRKIAECVIKNNSTQAEISGELLKEGVWNVWNMPIGCNSPPVLSVARNPSK